MNPPTTLTGLTFSEVAVSMPLVKLPVRSTIVELGSARVLISPSSVHTVDALRALGEVTDIVAPSLLHTAGMRTAAAAFPNARLWGPPGAREKLPELKWHGALGSDPWPYEQELPFVAIEGMPAMKEVVFLHRPSRALLVTDLAFNVTDPKGVGGWIIFNIFGTYRRFAVSRLFLKYVKDRPAFEASVRKIAALEFDHVVPGHGDIVRNDGKSRLLAAFRERGVLSPA